MPWFRLHLTNLCNFNCPGCHVFKISKNKVAETNMSYGVAEEATLFVIRMLKRYLPDVNAITLSVYGGEPLLNRQTLYRLLEKFGPNYQGININWIVNTNGSLLNKEDLERFLACGVDIHMSVDGGKQKHNKTRRDKQGRETFSRVMGAVDLIRRSNYPYLQFDSVANPFEIKNLNDILEVAREKGIARIHYDPYFSPDYPENFSVEEYASKYAEAYLVGKGYGINVFSTPFSQIYQSFMGRRPVANGQKASETFPAIEVFADGSFIFGELPLIRPFDFISKLGEDEVWKRRIGQLLLLEEEIDSDCEGCYLKECCYGQLRRIYRYHTITKKNEDNLCSIARKAVSILNQENFIPIEYAKR